MYSRVLGTELLKETALSVHDDDIFRSLLTCKQFPVLWASGPVAWRHAARAEHNGPVMSRAAGVKAESEFIQLARQLGFLPQKGRVPLWQAVPGSNATGLSFACPSRESNSDAVGHKVKQDVFCFVVDGQRSR